MDRHLFTADHHAYRDMVREFVNRKVVPNLQRWDADRLIDRDVWLEAGKQGAIGLGVPAESGGGGQGDYRYRMVVVDELCAVGAVSLNLSFGLQDDMVLPYLVDLTTDEQKRRWLPGMATGALIGAIAMTEPDAGSDLQGVRTTAVRDGEEWVLNGYKTFITNGINADVIIVVARTESDARSNGLSLIVVERDTPGFSRGRKLDKIGLHAQDTAELFFSEVRVPVSNLLGVEGRGFVHLMEHLPRERLSIAVSAMSSAEVIFAKTKRYCFERKAFGRPVGDFQHTRFVLAEIATELAVTRAYVDACVLAYNEGTLTGVDAANLRLSREVARHRL
jgi:long-chain-acyl-CoA dehydrogenase